MVQEGLKLARVCGPNRSYYYLPHRGPLSINPAPAYFDLSSLPYGERQPHRLLRTLNLGDYRLHDEFAHAYIELFRREESC